MRISLYHPQFYHEILPRSFAMDGQGLLDFLKSQVDEFRSLPVLSCSVTLEKKEPFLGKTILVGQPPKKKGEKRNWSH